MLLHDGEEIRGDDLGLPRGAAVHAAVSIERRGITVDLSSGGVSLAEIERTLIAEAMRAASGNRRRAAELLDISLETLRYRLEKYGIGASRQG